MVYIGYSLYRTIPCPYTIWCTHIYMLWCMYDIVYTHAIRYIWDIYTMWYI